jgi:hypothetical protein
MRINRRNGVGRATVANVEEMKRLVHPDGTRCDRRGQAELKKLAALARV